MAEPYVGEIRVVGFDYAPMGWLECDGALYPVGRFEALASIIGNRYGGDGKSNFAVPNFKDLAAVGQGQGPGLSPYRLAERGGVTQVTLEEGHVPLHTHQPFASNEPAEVQAPGPDRALARSTPGNAYQGEADLVEMNEAATSRVGEDASHNNLPPIQVLRFCIAHDGVFPPRQ